MKSNYFFAGVKRILAFMPFYTPRKSKIERVGDYILKRREKLFSGLGKLEKTLKKS